MAEGAELALSIFCSVLFTAWCIQWILHLIAIFYAKCKLHSETKVDQTAHEEGLPGVSILKPLTGTDSDLSGNLESYFALNYPKYEVIFCIQDEKATVAISLVKKLIEKYPSIQTQLHIGAVNVGINPKINNMYNGYKSATYDLIYIADAGLRARPDTLYDLVSTISRKHVGMVHQMPYFADRDDFTGAYHKIFFGTQHAKLYLSFNAIGINCTTGMSSMIRREIIETAGGLGVFGQFLAEDYFLAKAALDQGWSVRLCSRPCLQMSQEATVQSLQSRAQRWTKLRIAMLPHTAVLEPIGECMVCGVLASLATTYLFGWSPLTVFLVHSLAWFVCDYILLSAVNSTPLRFSKVEFLTGWLFREFFAFPIFMTACLDQSIDWRGKKFKIRWGGRVDPADMVDVPIKVPLSGVSVKDDEKRLFKLSPVDSAVYSGRPPPPPYSCHSSSNSFSGTKPLSPLINKTSISNPASRHQHSHSLQDSHILLSQSPPIVNPPSPPLSPHSPSSPHTSSSIPNGDDDKTPLIVQNV